MTYPAAQRRLQRWEETGFPYDDDAEVVRETRDALRVKSRCYNTIFWMPRKALHHHSHLPKNKRGLLVVRVWFALKARWLMRDGFVNSEHFWPKKKRAEQLELEL